MALLIENNQSCLMKMKLRVKVLKCTLYGKQCLLAWAVLHTYYMIYISRNISIYLHESIN